MSSVDLLVRKSDSPDLMVGISDSPDLVVRRSDAKDDYINYRFRAVRKSKGYTLQQLEELTGINEEIITSYETIRTFPTNERATKLSQALETNRTYLFPESLRELTIEIRKERREKASKKPRITTVPLTRSIKRSLIEPSSRNTFDNPQEDLYSTIDKMLEQLTPREREVIILRYGLPDSNREYLEPLTLKEIKGKFGITIEGVRKIEVKAIGKLRLSPKARLFRQLLTED